MIRSKSLCAVIGLAALVLCTSCLSMTATKDARVEPGTNTAKASLNFDNNLLDTWELMYQVDEKGNQEQPRESTRTVIEFNNKGQVIFNRSDKDTANGVNNKIGKFAVEKEEITITDDVGNTVRWPYQISGESLVLTMPELKKKFYWRRAK